MVGVDINDSAQTRALVIKTGKFIASPVLETKNKDPVNIVQPDSSRLKEPACNSTRLQQMSTNRKNETTHQHHQLA